MTLLYLTSAQGPASLKHALAQFCHKATASEPLAIHSVADTPASTMAVTTLVAELDNWREINNSVWLPQMQRPDLASVIICRTGSEQDALIATTAGANSYITGAVNPKRLPLIIATARVRQEQLQRLHLALNQAQQQLTDRITIEKAKGVIMQTRHCSEKDAYQQLRQRAMQHQQPMVELARQLLAIENLLQP